MSLLFSDIATDPNAFVVADNLSDSSAYGLGSSAPLIKIEDTDGKSVSLRIGNVTPDFG
ncbi:MAG: hypothetical protein ACLP05_05570 [Candidatus Kryptoniota bacterium]